MINGFFFADLDWKKRHKTFHDNFDKILQSKVKSFTFKWPKKNKFLGDKKDIPPDPVNQYDHKLPIAIVEPIHRLRNHEILEVD